MCICASVILLTCNLFLFNADVKWLPIAPLASVVIPGNQYSNSTFNIFIVSKSEYKLTLLLLLLLLLFLLSVEALDPFV